MSSAIDAGSVFDDLFAAAGADFDEAVSLSRLPVIARNAWAKLSNRN